MRKSIRVPIVMWLALAMCAAIMVTLFMVQAPAEAESPGLADSTTETPAAPYDWKQIATIPGAIAVTLLIVQYCKLPLDKVWRIPTRYLVLMIAFVLMAGAQAAIKGLTWPDVPLVLINAFVVALAAMGAYEVSYAKVGK